MRNYRKEILLNKHDSIYVGSYYLQEKIEGVTT